MSNTINELSPFLGKISGVAIAHRNSVLKKIKTVTLMVAVLGIFFAAGIFFYFSKSFAKNILLNVRLSEKMSEGDFTGRIKKTGNDELGILSSSMNKTGVNLSVLVGNIKSGADELNSFVKDLNKVISDISMNSSNSHEETSLVTKNIIEVKDNMMSIAAAVEEASVNIDSVASASEQMDHAIGGVAKSADETKFTAQEAVKKSKESFSRMEKLGNAADNISRFTFFIQDISAQTNLLALNATIEAARAGQAGKGFAVVADEIKALASQTVAATSDISSQVKDIQSASQELIQDVKNIISTMEDLESHFGSIAAAVDEQSSATREISLNVSQASQGIVEISTNISNTSELYTDISSKIISVSHSSEEVKELAGKLNGNSGKLEALAFKLKESSKDFKISTKH